MEHSEPSRVRLDFRRAALPEILFVPDLALALGGVSHRSARRAVLHGDCGPFLRIGRRLAVRRESLLEALRAREIQPLRADPSQEGRR